MLIRIGSYSTTETRTYATKLMHSDSQQKSILVPERRVFFFLHLSRFGEPVHLVSVAARQPAWVGPSWFAY